MVRNGEKIGGTTFWHHNPISFGRGVQGVKDQGSISQAFLEQFVLVFFNLRWAQLTSFIDSPFQ